MLRKLLPKSSFFFDLFDNHAFFITEAARLLKHFSFEDAIPEKIFQEIKKIEHEADQVTRECIEELHKTFITPIDRLDIHRLISKMDDIIDEIEDIAKLVVIYKVDVFQEDALSLVNILIKSTAEVQKAVGELRKMKLTGSLSNHFASINSFETEADAILARALGKLFDEEVNIKNLIKWKEVYEHLEQATDECEDVANILEGIILENA